MSSKHRIHCFLFPSSDHHSTGDAFLGAISYRRERTVNLGGICLFFLLAGLLLPFLSFSQSMQNSIRIELTKMKTEVDQMEYLNDLYHKTFYENVKEVDVVQYFLDSLGRSTSNLEVQAIYYNALGFKFYNQRNVDSIILYYSKCLDAARPLHLYDHMIKSHRFIGMMAGMKQQFDQAYAHIDTAILLSKDQGDIGQLIESHVVQALIIKDFHGKEQEANEINILVDSIVTANDINSIPAVNNKINLANSNFTSKQLDRSIAYSKEALKMSKAIEFPYGEIACKCDLANLYVVSEINHDSLRSYSDQCYAYFKDYPPHNLRHLRSNYIKGILARKQHQVDSAKYFLNVCREAIRDNPMVVISSIVYANLFELYMDEKNFDEAEAVLVEYENYCASSTDERICTYEPLKLRSTINFYKGNYEQAFIENRKAQAKIDSFRSADRQSEIVELNTKYETERKSREIVALELSNNRIKEKQNRQLLIFVCIAMLLGMLALLSWFYYKNSKKTAQKLQELDRLKNDIFTNLSHELRTPLTLIKGITNKLLQGSITSSQRYDLELIADNSTRLGSMINQLFDLSKVELAVKQIQTEKLNVFRYIAGLASNYVSMAAERNILLEINVPKEDVDDVWIDKQILDTVVHNLMTNAFKYTKSRVTIDASFEQNLLRLNVSDDGLGISDEEKQKIFERFYQIQDGKNSGLGVGLSLVKDLIALHQGTITVRNQEKGGAQFAIEIPAGLDEFRATQSQVSDAQLNALSKELIESEKDTVLIIDDNDDIHYLLNSMLSQQYKLIKATNGKEGLEKAKEHMPDLIISDLMMPIMDGYAFAKALRKDRLVADIPLIMLTAKADLASKIEGLAIGVDDYLIKPFDESELNLRIKNFILRRTQMRNKFHQQTSFQPKEISINDQDASFWQDLKSLLQKDLGNADLKIDGLAKQLNMSRTQLFRKIKKSTGKSPSQFLEIQRLQWAAELLKESKLSISEIAYQVGFGDTSYFSKRFKSFIGQTPTDFRS